MRCLRCKIFTSDYQYLFSIEKKTHTYLCDMCYQKHPVFITHHVIPNERQMIHVFDVNYDGTYPSIMYESFFTVLMTWIVTLKYQPYVLSVDDISYDILQQLAQLNWSILILNYKNTKQRSNEYDL